LNNGEAARTQCGTSWQSIQVEAGPGERCLRAKLVRVIARTVVGFESLPSPPINKRGKNNGWLVGGFGANAITRIKIKPRPKPATN